ncbi:MAG: phosphoribosylformylglycinamidine synthase subunit PurL [Oligoflexia bacterium]|nr:MAG: phosphoribosylformylglycinamidine synthase subunit PurL [Oligoflexia bacterium]
MNQITHEGKLKHYRISQAEYEKICSMLGRPPEGVEWALFSALWSEHCSYKSSKIHLKKFGKTLNQTVVNAEGENAGVVDLGQGERVVFKMESHNHPSFIEPYQGAATGVGGILRDIFTMGARPIGLADYLCFGNIEADRMKTLVEGVVKGISGYGNSVGVPTVTGQTNFDPAYNKNILVNAMAVGLLRPNEKVSLSAAKGPGNCVVYVGAKTGKDGVHGAAMASESFDENSEAKKPNVQIGDPYFEKLLIESCFEVLQKNLVVAIQDMGAAGITSSSFEMSSKGQVGMMIQLDQVPVRDSSIQPEEILLSESQERMLLVCEPQKFSELSQVFEKWGLDAVIIGEVIAERKVKLYWKGHCLTSIDPDLLVEKAPVYERPYHAWKSQNQTEKIHSNLQPKDYISQLISYLGSTHGTARDYICSQYDQRVGLMTARGADHDVAILRLPDSKRGLGMTVGCRPSVMKCDAQLGGFDSVFYPALQMAAKGIKTLAITDCLNFGNPEKPEIMSEFVAAVEAIRDASLILDAPVVSGNVSFYNETLGQNIISTPATGLIGLRETVAQIPEDQFQKIGSQVYLLSSVSAKMLSPYFENKKSWIGKIEPQKTGQFIQKIQKLSLLTSVLSTQAVGRGGLGVSLARMCRPGFGFQSFIEMSVADLITETFYEVIFEVDHDAQHDFETKLKAENIDYKILGKVTERTFNLSQEIHVDLLRVNQAQNKGLGGFIENLA